MAQTGYTPILIYSSSTVSNLPSASNLTNSTLGSELAINITDGKLFYKDNAGVVQVIGWKTVPTTAGGTGLTSYTAGDTLYYASGSTLTKLAIGASKTIMTSSGTAPQWSASLDTTQGGTGLTSYTAGDLTYYASGTSLTKLGIGSANTVLTSNGSAPQWTAQSSLAVGTASNLLSNATTGVMQIVGPAASTTRVMTIPNANFTAARTDAAQTFTGNQTFSNNLVLNSGLTSDAGILKNTGQGYGVGSDRWIGSDGTTSVWFYNVPTGGKHYFAVNNTNIVEISGNDLKFLTGNLIQGTAAKGINFTANSAAAGMTSQLLNWYEEGTWTPTVTSGSGTITTYASSGTYTRVGRQVTVTAYVDLTNVGTAGGLLVISNFPYKNGAASNAGYLQQSGIVRETGVTGVNYACFITGNSTTGYIQSLTGGAISWTNTYQYALSITYYTA